jgi:acyl-CoA dehydrogenase
MVVSVMDSPTSSGTLRAEVRSFLAQGRANDDWAPTVDSWHTGFSRSFSRALAAIGWLCIALPKEVGGGGKSYSERFVVAEELLAAGAPVAAHWISERQIAPALFKLGTKEQQQRFLPGITRGELVFGLGMSEPDSGSDLASIRTRARRVDGGWLLSGQKIWTSLAAEADFLLVLCRTSQAEDRHSGMSQLIVGRSSPGVDVRPIATTTGNGHFCEVFFTDVEVPDECLLGTEGDGWRQIMSELAYERGGPERYLSTFPLFSALVSDLSRSADRSSLEVVGNLTAELSAFRSLAEQVCAAMDEGRPFARDAALLKDAGTKFEQRLVQEVRRCMRADVALDNDNAGARLFRQALLASPTFTLRGGTTEVLRGIIAKELYA